MKHRVHLSLGSNIHREQNIRQALTKLENRFGSLKVSPIYESEAVGFDGDRFLNLIVLIETDLSLTQLSQLLKRMEDEQGRDRKGAKFGARTLDIDIVTYDDRVGEYAGIELPRPELYYNAFVLRPMADLDPEGYDPKTRRTYRELFAEFSGDQKLWQIEFSA